MSRPDEKASSPAVRAARERAEAAERDKQGGTTGRVVDDPQAPGGQRVDLKVRIPEIPDTGVDVVERFGAAWLNELFEGQPGAQTGWWVEAPGGVALTLGPAGGGLLRLSGTGDFTMTHSCVRCLEPVDYELELPFALTLTEGKGEIFAGEEYELDPSGLAEVLGDEASGGEPLGDDEDFVTYQGDTVDLAQVIREQVFLELPMHPRCDDKAASARGPCLYDPEGKAEAEKERWTDPRWEALKALKDKMKN